MTSSTVIFEKKCEDGWKTVPSDALREGDITRIVGCGVPDEGEELRVAGRNGVDPDSACRFDLMLEPI